MESLSSVSEKRRRVGDMITCKKRVFMLFQSPKKMMLMEKSHILGSIQNSVTIYHAAAAT